MQVLHDVSCETDEGEFMVVVGPSGFGTLIRMIAGSKRRPPVKSVLMGSAHDTLAGHINATWLASQSPVGHCAAHRRMSSASFQRPVD